MKDPFNHQILVHYWKLKRTISKLKKSFICNQRQKKLSQKLLKFQSHQPKLILQFKCRKIKILIKIKIQNLIQTKTMKINIPKSILTRNQIIIIKSLPNRNQNIFKKTKKQSMKLKNRIIQRKIQIQKIISKKSRNQ